MRPRIKKIKDMAGRAIGCVLLAALLFVFLLPMPAASAETRTIRVGYVASGGMLEEQNGTYTGYAADYLRVLCEYNDWACEYIEGTLNENMELLASGEIDLLFMIRHTEERDERFIFSELPMAFDYTAVRTLLSSPYYYGDHTHFNGASVGVVGGTVHVDNFRSHVARYGVQCDIVEYDSDNHLNDALASGDVDLIATGGLAICENTKLVGRLNIEGAYFITGPDNQQFMDALNHAIQRSRVERPDLHNELLEKYFDNAADVALTREEQAYTNSAGPITVWAYGGRRPLGYTADDGSFAGVLPDYMDMLGEMTGLEFVLEEAPHSSLPVNLSLMPEEGAVMLLLDRDLQELGVRGRIYKTDPLFDTGISYIMRLSDAESFDDSAAPPYPARTFAMGRDTEHIEQMLLADAPGSAVVYYETAAECMEALLEGKADMAVLDEYVAAYQLQKPEYDHKLSYVSGAKHVHSVCLYVPEKHRLLADIIDKTAASLTEEETVNFISGAMIDHSYAYRLEDALYEYGGWIALIGAMVVVMILLAVLAIVRVIKFRSEKARAEELQERIQLDPLTGTYNRGSFFDKAREMIDRGGDDLHIVRMNVCHFKLINEIYGAEKGDMLLQEMGRDLTAMGRQSGFIVGRFTGDHFYLCIDRKALDEFPMVRQAPAPWLGMDVTMTYGIYPVGDQKDQPVNIMCDRADMAIANRDLSSEHVFWYDDEIRRRMLRDQEIEQDKEAALAERQFCIYIQPKYDVATGTVSGGEALVRWLHPEKGMVSPGHFIPVFEQDGFIRELDYYVWDACCAFIRHIHDRGTDLPPISINVSRIHFYGSELQPKLMELMDKYSLTPASVELEITETIYAEDPEIIIEKCEQLRALGFRIAMDDFGSGYSSLNMLKRIPLDVLKMDLNFLTGDNDPEQRDKGHSILRNLIRIAHELNLCVVVEGVETAEQRDFIREIGGCMAQGYFYARPMPLDEFEALLGE